MTNSSNIYPLRIADAQNRIRHVFVRDLELKALIGVYGHEKGKPQPICVNVDLTVDEGTGAVADRLRNVVDYEKVVDAIRAIIARGHVNLVETLAEQVAEICLKDKRVLVARVRIEKLKAIAGAKSVGVEIERRSPNQ
jgi:7,8-dihydroneopterin aldolase/epimerase/oxygenase